MVDKRKNILFIGTNDMGIKGEIERCVKEYKNGLFIEAIPKTYERLKKNLLKAKEYNTNFIPINALVTSVKDKKYKFNIYNNEECSSSIYEQHDKNWRDVWKKAGIKKIEEIELISTTAEDIIKNFKWENKKYDCVIDVQGAELEVLKGFGKNNIDNIENLKIEYSTVEYYKGGVLFPELNKFLIEHNFKLIKKYKKTHGDVIYVKK